MEQPETREGKKRDRINDLESATCIIKRTQDRYVNTRGTALFVVSTSRS